GRAVPRLGDGMYALADVVEAGILTVTVAGVVVGVRHRVGREVEGTAVARGNDRLRDLQPRQPLVGDRAVELVAVGQRVGRAGRLPVQRAAGARVVITEAGAGVAG